MSSAFDYYMNNDKIREKASKKFWEKAVDSNYKNILIHNITKELYRLDSSSLETIFVSIIQRFPKHKK